MERPGQLGNPVQAFRGVGGGEVAIRESLSHVTYRRRPTSQEGGLPPSPCPSVLIRECICAGASYVPCERSETYNLVAAARALNKLLNSPDLLEPE